MREALSIADQHLAVSIASARTEVNRKRGNNNLRVSHKPQAEVELNGMAAEIFAARYFGVEPDTQIGDETYPAFDFKTNKGATVDVKFSATESGNLLVYPNKKNNPCDYYVMVKGNFPCYEMYGYATADEVFLDENYTTIKGKGAYQVMKEKLRKFNG